MKKSDSRIKKVPAAYSETASEDCNRCAKKQSYNDDGYLIEELSNLFGMGNGEYNIGAKCPDNPEESVDDRIKKLEKQTKKLFELCVYLNSKINKNIQNLVDSSNGLFMIKDGRLTINTDGAIEQDEDLYKNNFLTTVITGNGWDDVE